MITFKVDHEDKIFVCTMKPENTIEDVKNSIRTHYEIPSHLYIDVEICLDRPIRSLGKFNVDIGVMPRTMDRYSLDRFEMDERTIPCKISVVERITVKTPIRKKTVHGPVTKSSLFNIEKTQQTFTNSKASYDIQNTDEFPSL